MANTDSFIEEVTEEVRRDRLFALFRRYGWIGALVILVIVGAAGYREWADTRRQEAAEALGDGILAAEAAGDPASVGAALDALGATGDRQALIGFAKARTLFEAREIGAAADALEAVAANSGISKVYRDLAELKAIWIRADSTSPEDLIRRLSLLETAGSPFRLLAAEAKAHALIRLGQFEEALTVLREIEEETGVPQGLRTRAAQLIATIEPI